MKNLKLLLALPGMLAVHVALAQTDAHLKLSDQYPAAGEKITLTYGPAGAPLDGKNGISAAVYFLDNKDNPVADIDLKAGGKLLNGEILIPATAKAFFIKIYADEQIDNNNDKGYLYLIYKDKQPVEGAYASEAYLLSSGLGNYFGKIKTDNKEGTALYQKEFALYPASKAEYGNNYYYLIARSPEYKTEVVQKIGDLEKSNDEKELTLANNLLNITKNSKQADSLGTVIKQRFPNGTFVKNELYRSLWMEKDIHKKDSLFNIYASKYPEVPSDKTTSLDNLRVQLASAYLEKGDMDNYNKYYSQMKNKSGIAVTLNNTAYEWAKSGDRLDEAQKMSKESLDLLSSDLADPHPSPYTSNKQAKKNLQFSYDLYADTYAWILYKQNKLEEALKFEQPVIEHGLINEQEVNEHYIIILNAVGQYDKAKATAETLIKNGKGSEVIRQELKNDYVKAKGSDKGYELYLASLESAAKAKAMADLTKTMINQPAPAFALKDIDGNTVSLTDLKGKVVVVDFWATWCGPCEASFPGMQMAVNKYKDNPNVKFLFVDTWENGKDYEPGVKKFIADNKYTFHVLMDEKNDEGRQAKVVTAYGVDGIPTKFIIDKDGNIRFKYVGYSGSSDKVLDEVSNMIDLTGNPEMATATGAAPTKGK